MDRIFSDDWSSFSGYSIPQRSTAIQSLKPWQGRRVLSHLTRLVQLKNSLGVGWCESCQTNSGVFGTVHRPPPFWARDWVQKDFVYTAEQQQGCMRIGFSINWKAKNLLTQSTGCLVNIVTVESWRLIVKRFVELVSNSMYFNKSVCFNTLWGPVAVLTNNDHNQLLLCEIFVIVKRINKHIRFSKVQHELLSVIGV